MDNDKREIWFTREGRSWAGIFERSRIVHWKGYALYVGFVVTILASRGMATVTGTADKPWWVFASAVAVGVCMLLEARHTKHLDDN